MNTGKRTYANPCGVARGLDVIGERWALLVVRDLLLGPKRFNDLLAGLPGVSPNVLSQRLRELVDQGVVRKRDLGAPTRVRLYELSEWGAELEPLLLELGRWGSRAPAEPQGLLGIDSLILGVKAGFDPARSVALEGVYELDIDDDTYVAKVADGRIEVARVAAAGPVDAAFAADLATMRAVCEGVITVAEAVESGAARSTGTTDAQQRLADLLWRSAAAAPSRLP
ncbi:hypothetical protein GCM10009839_02820 [Catenulispora yoronensis]|uniref:HTH hxlR-type domain-containing protein n=1 Tax=Catenulispora yoronensis TaxID=450799 RepID=A0ABP5EYT1_9ACTN